METTVLHQHVPTVAQEGQKNPHHPLCFLLFLAAAVNDSEESSVQVSS